MKSPRISNKSFSELYGEGWRRIHELQRQVNKQLESVPSDGELPYDVSHSELCKILAQLPAEFDDYVLCLPGRGSNTAIYDGRLVSVLKFIVIARRLRRPLSNREIVSLLHHST